ncbi:hypothetical protein BpHYR1_033714 [Brachionus plicatilis]|uniref:Uncharacterized protein n=1 Tax=Brachionus plicatilis TaxID=10195 RepID=A0A3M7R140_BRAPC|nr:hypothetical protein BpHYR1_033714 [Brachionus plicatilis]
MNKLTVLFLFQIGICLSFPSKNERYIFEIEDLKLENIKGSNVFPNSFSMDLNQYANDISGSFNMVDDYLIPPVSHLKNGRLQRIAFESNSDHQTYREKSGKGFATLFKRNGQIKAYARFFESENGHLELLPSLKQENGKNSHILHR